MVRSISKIKKENKLVWDIQKNTEDVEKWVQKKEELVKEIKENNSLSGRSRQNKKNKYMDFYRSRGGHKFVFAYFSKFTPFSVHYFPS